MKNEKTLLQEGSVRRFMKLASLQPLTEEFVQNMYEEEEEEFSPEPPADELAPPTDEPEALDLEPAAAGDIDVASLVDAIATAIETETGVPISVEGEPGEEAEPDLAPEAPEEEAELPPIEGDEALEEETFQALEEEDVVESPQADAQTLDEEDIVKEVTRRVSMRLVKESRRQKNQEKAE